MKKISLYFVLFFLLTSCSVSVPTYNSAPKQIVIGGISSLSGVTSSYGMVIRNAIQLRIEQLNAAGGINGTPVKIIWRDGKCNQDSSYYAADELVRQHGVNMIIGGVCSDETIGAARVTEANEVILMSPLSTNPKITNLGKYIYRTIPSDATQGKILARHIQENNIKRVLVLIEETSYTEGILDVFMENYNGFVKIVPLKTDHIGDIGEAIEKGRELKADELLLLAQSVEMAYSVISELESSNWTAGILGNSPFVNYPRISTDFAKYLYDHNARGTIYTLSPEKLDDLETFASQYQHRYGEEVVFYNYVGSALDAVDVLFDAMKKADSLKDTDSIRKELDLLQHEGYMGKIEFDKYGDLKSGFSLVKFNGREFVEF